MRTLSEIPYTITEERANVLIDEWHFADRHQEEISEAMRNGGNFSQQVAFYKHGSIMDGYVIVEDGALTLITKDMEPYCENPEHRNSFVHGWGMKCPCEKIDHEHLLVDRNIINPNQYVSGVIYDLIDILDTRAIATLLNANKAEMEDSFLLYIHRDNPHMVIHRQDSDDDFHIYESSDDNDSFSQYPITREQVVALINDGSGGDP